MDIVYAKTLKGTEEIALRSYGLSLRLRPYLLIVDGAKSLSQIVTENPALPEIAMVLKSLEGEGYIATRSAAVAGGAALKVGNGGNVRSFPANAPATPARQDYAGPQTEPLPARSTAPAANQKLDYIRSQMAVEISALLGKDASLVLAKIQACANADELFATLMGLKKIIGMYADAETAERFVQKFSSLAKM